MDDSFQFMRHFRERRVGIPVTNLYRGTATATHGRRGLVSAPGWQAATRDTMRLKPWVVTLLSAAVAAPGGRWPGDAGEAVTVEAHDAEQGRCNVQLLVKKMVPLVGFFSPLLLDIEMIKRKCSLKPIELKFV